MSEHVEPIVAIDLDGQAIGFRHGVLVTASELPCDDWVVILLDVETSSMRLIGREHTLSVLTRSGLTAEGEVSVDRRDRRLEYTRLRGLGILRQEQEGRAA